MADAEKEFTDVLSGMHMPKMEMKNQSDQYVLMVQLDVSSSSPIQPEDIQVEIEGCSLSLSATHTEHSKFGDSMYSEQISVGAVPRDIDAEAAVSHYNPKTQTLTVTLPKHKSLKKKKLKTLTWADQVGSTP